MRTPPAAEAETVKKWRRRISAAYRTHAATCMLSGAVAWARSRSSFKIGITIVDVCGADGLFWLMAIRRLRAGSGGFGGSAGFLDRATAGVAAGSRSTNVTVRDASQ